jgi:hypothetical protein
MCPCDLETILISYFSKANTFCSPVNENGFKFFKVRAQNGSLFPL